MQKEHISFKKRGLFTNEKTRIRNLILIIAPFFILMVVFVIFTIISVKKLSPSSENEAPSYSNEIEGMNIFLRSNATDLQKDLFKQLQTAYSEGNDEEAAKLTAECFIADFYTWTNKYGSYDVGGVYYCADRYNLELFGRDTFYKYVSYYIDEYGSNNLLEVVSISAEGGFVPDKKYTIEESGKSYDYYYFEVRWEYANHPNFTSNEYITMNAISVIKSDTGRFEIVEAYG